MTQNTEKIVGLLGGMGPEATADFFSRLIAATPAKTDQDHLHILIDNNPKVANRHLAIAGKAPGVGPDLAAMARRLEGAGADFLVMVCNTAHAFAGDIEASVSIPLVSFIDEVADHIKRTCTPGPVGLMAASGCLEAGLYQEALEARGFEPVCWNGDNTQAFMELVFRIKAGERDASMGPKMADLAEDLVKQGARHIISGCTEIPLVLAPDDVSVPLHSSTDLLVQRTLDYATGKYSLPHKQH